MEYVQFHPTTLYLPGERSFLLTEALRGCGAILRNHEGEAFAKRYHPNGELAPRDIVARMIVHEMQRTGKTHVYLDITHKDSEWLKERFPSVHEHTKSKGLDFTKDLLPTVPAQHYFCGGVETDVNGATSIDGLYAAGEVACTGLHGANRLASTSLLEGVVFGTAIADKVAFNKAVRALLNNDGADCATDESPVRPIFHKGKLDPDLKAIDEYHAKIKYFMTTYVGIIRRPSELLFVNDELYRLSLEIEEYFHTNKLCRETVLLRNAVTTASLIASAALENKESIGTHFLAPDSQSVPMQVEVEEKRAAVQGL